MFKKKKKRRRMEKFSRENWWKKKEVTRRNSVFQAGLIHSRTEFLGQILPVGFLEKMQNRN